MKPILKTLAAALLMAGAIAAPGLVQARPVTLTTQLQSYSGDGAYLAFYLTDAKGQYKKNALGSWQKIQVLQPFARLGARQWLESQRV